MVDSLVSWQQEERVAWLTLNQPERRNPLSSATLAALSQSLDKAFLEDSIRVVVITALGPVFSAGHDLAEMTRRDSETESDWRGRIQHILASCAEMMMKIVHGPKPVIACVQGMATAAGCQLVSACDLAIADTQAQFCTPGVNLGAFCTTPLVGIGRNVSRKHALEMALTGNRFSAEDAVRFGLINRHVPSDQLLGETTELATLIASKSRDSIRRGKSAFYQQVDMPLAEAFTLANQVMLDALTTDDDAARGVEGFLSKQPVDWSAP